MREKALGNCNTQSALARILRKHFNESGKLAIEITPQCVNDWRNGRRLPPDAQLPPTKVGDTNYWSADEWSKWIKKWILPYYDRKKIEYEGKIISPAEIERMRILDEVEELRANQRKREIEEGKWIRKDDAARIRRGALVILRGLFRRIHEHTNTAKRGEFLLSKLSIEDMAAFKEFDLQLERGVVDRLEAECETMTLQEPELGP